MTTLTELVQELIEKNANFVEVVNRALVMKLRGAA